MTYKMCVLIFSAQEELKVQVEIYVFMQSNLFLPDLNQTSNFIDIF